MSIKEDLRAFWKATEGYDGDISCRKVKEEKNCTFYQVETEGNTFEAVVHNEDTSTIFYHVIDRSDWHSTDGNDVVLLDGIPYLADFGNVPPTSRASFIAQEAGVSLVTVYSRAKKLGRLPTVEEAKPKRAGRKPKYL